MKLDTQPFLLTMDLIRFVCVSSCMRPIFVQHVSFHSILAIVRQPRTHRSQEQERNPWINKAWRRTMWHLDLADVTKHHLKWLTPHVPTSCSTYLPSTQCLVPTTAPYGSRGWVTPTALGRLVPCSLPLAPAHRIKYVSGAVRWISVGGRLL